MKKIILLGLFILLLPMPVSAQSSLRISPSKAVLNAQPGSTAKTTITLENTTNKVTTVTVVIRDFKASDEHNGEPVLLEINSSAYSLANWFTSANLSKKLTIPANQRIEYEAIFRVPSSAVPKTYYGALTFTPDSSAQTASSIGSLVFISVGNPPSRLTIDSLTFNTSEDATKSHGIFTVLVDNSAEGLSTPTLKLKVTDENGKIVTDLNQDDEGSILPNSKRKFTFSPTSELPNSLLTATVTAVDQNGVTADKSMQLDRKPPAVKANIEQQLNPKDYGRTLLAGIAIVVITVIGLISIRLRHGTKNAPE